jgi:acyl-coenzyme A thioesterase PaaI-like protein
MNAFDKLIKSAEKSPFKLWMLNQALWFKIPFNKPHGLKITRVSERGFEIQVPYRRSNLNHLKGIHACALATASEYVAGLSLIRFLNPESYRLILESLRIQYFYQAKEPVKCEMSVSEEFIRREVLDPLEKQDAVFVELVSKIYDEQTNLICETTTRWQVKSWKKVKTKV